MRRHIDIPTSTVKKIFGSPANSYRLYFNREDDSRFLDRRTAAVLALGERVLVAVKSVRRPIVEVSVVGDEHNHSETITRLANAAIEADGVAHYPESRNA